jgi:purine-nucleoside phosphorylase
MSDPPREAASFVRQHCRFQPRAALILGTGFQDLTTQVEVAASLPYSAIPHFPRPTAPGHAGRLVCGWLAGLPVIVLEGRCHLYEGYSLEQVTMPIRMLHELGVTDLVVSNAAGGLNPRMGVGDLMAIADHVNLMGSRIATCGSTAPLAAYPSRGVLYDDQLIAQAQRIARQKNLVLHRGVYVAVLGPNYETRAEYRALRRIGGDCVGMSTVPEALAAGQCGMRILAISAVTNVASPDLPRRTDAEQVVDVASHAEPRLRALIVALAAEGTIGSPSAEPLPESPLRAGDL